MSEEIANGMRVQDAITKVEGYVVAIVFYFTGCTQVLVQPRAANDYTKPKAHWFDVQRLRIMDRKILELPESLSNDNPSYVRSSDEEKSPERVLDQKEMKAQHPTYTGGMLPYPPVP